MPGGFSSVSVGYSVTLSLFHHQWNWFQYKRLLDRYYLPAAKYQRGSFPDFAPARIVLVVWPDVGPFEMRCVPFQLQDHLDPYWIVVANPELMKHSSRSTLC